MGPTTCTFRTRARSGPLGPQLTMRDSLGAFSFPEEETGSYAALQTQDNDHSSCLILILSLAAPIGSSSSLQTQTIVVLGLAFSLQPLAFILSEEAKYRERQ